MENYIEEMLVELAGDMPAEVERVRKEWENGNIIFLENIDALNSYMKNRKDKNKSINVYQMEERRWAVDESLLEERVRNGN